MAWQDNVIEPRPHKGKVVIKLEIECGETTCASEPGKFCRFVGAMRFGTIPICLLFPDRESPHTRLEDKDGWLQRCPQCMENGHVV